MKSDESLPLSQNPLPPTPDPRPPTPDRRPSPLATSRMLIYASMIPQKSIYFSIHFCSCLWQLFYQRSIFIRLTAGYVSLISFTVFKIKPIRGRQSSKGHNFSSHLAITVSFAGGQTGTKWPTSKDATKPAPSPICIIHGVFSCGNTEGQFVMPLVEIRKKNRSPLSHYH